ncbi:N-acetylmuramoyl-L-alanine amidase [Ligilactobacillus agilis]|nr:N-acetylmuramoyl-L-alanine amidase [Ligilactobacillus agilis]
MPEQNKTVYYASNGQMQYGQQQINGHWYLFDKWSGAMQTGFQNIPEQNKTVYYASNGQMQYGWQKIGEDYYYFDLASGEMMRGQKKLGNVWYNFNLKTGKMSTGFTYLEDQKKTVYYDKNGHMQYGQQQIQGKWYLFDKASGEMKTGFQYIPEQSKTVYYANNGQMQYGWQLINGKYYYFDTASGELYRGIKKINNKLYYLDDNGVMKKNELIYDAKTATLKYASNDGSLLANNNYKVGSEYYTFNSLGVLQHSKGEAKIIDKWYLFGNDNKVLVGFQKLIDGRTVYYDISTAQMQYGQQQINGHWYLFDKWSGAMQTGFQYISEQNKTVYYANNGQMQYGRQNINGHWYIFDTASGDMYRGWKTEGNDWYYYDKDSGQMRTGNVTINGVNYTFDNNGKQILNYNIDYTYALAPGEGDDAIAANNYIVLHEVGTESGAAANASYFKHNLNRSETYVTFVVGDGGKVYQVGKPGQVSWGAGYNANHNAPVQIELGRTWNGNQFWQDYVTYIRLARDMAGKYDIPLTLDAGSAGTRGIKSHNWVSHNIWGDHVDPYGYLARFGVSRSKLAHDLMYGV